MSSTEESNVPNEEVAGLVADTPLKIEASDAKDEDTMSNLKSMVHDTKVAGGKSVWATTLETFGMADGKGEKSDVVVGTEEEGMSSIKSMIGAVKDESPKWQFTLTPLGTFNNATMDDMLRAFVLWSNKDEETTFNVSKAFRRLEIYATWMEDHRSVLEAPLELDSLTVAAHAWQCKATHDIKGRLIWWFDIGALDVAAIKKGIPHDDSLRFFVWLSHLIMLDKQAQKNGMVLVEGMGGKGMIETMTMVPRDLGTKLDRLTIGVLPLKMRSIYIFNHKRWLGILMGMMKPFLSKKMRQRIVVIPKNQEPQKAIDEEIGRDCIPVGFGGLEGRMEDDIIFGQYIK